MLDELFNYTFGIRGLMSDQTAYTLNSGTANYTEQNFIFLLFSGYMQMAYEKLHVDKYIF